MLSSNYPVSKCRICGFKELKVFLDLGEIPISGKFSTSSNDEEKLPLYLARCEKCGLHQLLHCLPTEKLYGPDYGYESHLNSSMVEHLREVADSTFSEYLKLNGVKPRVIVDIASNDGSLLSKFNDLDPSMDLYGVDPLVDNFADFYPKGTKINRCFFSSKARLELEGQGASIVTSLSVFYDLDDPVDFAQGVWNLLDWGGIWHLEQSYFPLMLENNSFDTICHEHFLYLRGIDFKNIFDEIGFKVVSCKKNKINGGSIALSIRKSSEPHCQEFKELIENEVNSDLNLDAGLYLANQIRDSRIKFQNLLRDFKSEGYRVVGLGASTKGNILLNVFDVDSELLEVIGEINPKKFGKITPGSHIPIVPESQVLSIDQPRQAIVILPWHFRETFIEKTKDRRALGDKVIFPLPEIEVLG